ncbi:MAG: cupin [Lutibacter sp.]|nr:MAG: cupin [Lutibacter sp.]
MESANILENLNYNEDKVAISVLFETETTKEIRILFKKGQLMKKHQTKFPITVEIVEGAIDFGVEDETHNLLKGTIVSLEGSVPHDLLAQKDSIVRLTLSKLDSVDRVKDVVK